ncbi:divergent protein kinase domain 2B [Bombina bombina]|uniref:divergent protein kinase domain 2B n=1 Tax=Bombina bombina TaxID=8345 RepID=UPI00235ABDAA|nr:divergent protein kinase domain 2B [Bombina bombina]
METCIYLFSKINGQFVLMLLFSLAKKEHLGASSVNLESKLQSSYNFGKSFLGLDKCNACIGTSACKKFFKEELRFDSWLAPHLQLPPDSLQNYSGNYTDDGEAWKPVEIFRLASKHQHDMADKMICNSRNPCKTCSIEMVLRKTQRFQKWLKAKRLTPELVQSLQTPFLLCPSQRLLDRIVRRYTEVFDAGSVYMTHLTDKDKLRLLYTLSVNAHPIVLQIFPGAEGWPFPKYLGSCGRLFLSTSIMPLTAFYSSPPDTAADLAYQLLQIIHYLRNNDLNYLFYFTDVDVGTFGTYSDGRVFIRNASRLGVIDLQQNESENVRTNEESDIFSFLSSDTSSKHLSCENINAAHNLVLVCKELLPRLLFQKFPNAIQQEIDHYLSDCTNNVSNDLEAQKILNKLMKILHPWQTCDARFAYRYPECRYSTKP